MKKVSENIILYTVIFACVIIIIFILFYGQPYTQITEEKLRVYQLAITALAATVGVGTVANSAKSARISAESMELTKEKEKREQSSHLIIMSFVEKVTLTLPYMISSSNLYLNDYKIEGTENSIETQVFKARASKDKRYKQNIDIHKIKLFNSGKGSAVNLESEFIFKNLKEFKNHLVSLPEAISVVRAESYSLEIKKHHTDEKFYVVFKNIYIKNKLNDLKVDEKEIDKIIKEVFYLSKVAPKIYIDIVKPQDDLELSIPNEFIMLTKHYLIVKQLQREIQPIIKNFSGKPFVALKKFLEYEPILPIGEINLTYYDESLIRSGEYQSQKLTKLNYIVKCKEISNDPTNPQMYIEVNLLDSEKQI